jgi:O-antigen ligase
MFAYDSWLARRTLNSKNVRYWLIVGGLSVYFLTLIASTISFEGTINARIGEELWVAFACVVVAALGAELIRRDAAFALKLARYLMLSATVAGVILLVTASAEGPLGSFRLHGYPDINYVLNPNAVGGVFAILFSLSLGHMLSRDRGRMELATTLAVAVLLITITFLTGSRSSMLACLLAIGLVPFALSPRLAIGVSGALVIAAAAIALAFPDWLGSLLARGDSRRLDLWPVYFGMGLERPWTGYGLFFDQRIQIDGHTIYTPHNILLAAFIHGGVGACLALCLVLAAAALAALRAARCGWWLPATTFAAMIGLGSVDHEVLASTFSYLWYLFYLPIGLCAGASLAPAGGGRKHLAGLVCETAPQSDGQNRKTPNKPTS